jgi:hypothetical protein
MTGYLAMPEQIVLERLVLLVSQGLDDLQVAIRDS